MFTIMRKAELQVQLCQDANYMLRKASRHVASAGQENDVLLDMSRCCDDCFKILCIKSVILYVLFSASFKSLPRDEQC